MLDNLLSILAYIAACGAAGTYIYKACKPLRDFGKEHETLKKDVEALKRNKDKVSETMDGINEANKVVMKSILALMNAQLDGDATALKKNIKEIQNYLIDTM